MKLTFRLYIAQVRICNVLRSLVVVGSAVVVVVGGKVGVSAVVVGVDVEVVVVVVVVDVVVGGFVVGALVIGALVIMVEILESVVPIAKVVVS